MSLIAQTLHVSRSNLIAQVRRPAKPRGPYGKAGDAALLALIREIVDQRASYGYRRVTALVNRQLTAHGKPRVNAKRVLRIMRLHSLTLEKHTARRPGRTHDGVVIALRSNVRWCSDHLEIQCRNGEVVRVLFAIDACDREIIAWSAVTGAGISGEMVRDLMIACVERRFGTTRTPHPVEWLSDNGICEALVKTLRRDYIRLAVLPDAASAMVLLPGWIEDYNEVHPHSRLRFLSPREFRRLSA